MEKEHDTPYKVGQRVKKAGKEGTIISYTPQDVTVMWLNGQITHEDPYVLTLIINPGADYMRKVRRI